MLPAFSEREERKEVHVWSCGSHCHVGRGRRYHEAESETSKCVWRRSGPLVLECWAWRWAVGFEALEFVLFFFFFFF